MTDDRADQESVAEVLKRIDDRTSLMMDIFTRHVGEDRQDFGELRRIVSEIPDKAAAAAQDRVDARLTAIGVNVGDPTAHQKDQAILRAVRVMADEGNFFESMAAVKRWRDAQATVKRAGLRAAAGILVAGIFGLLWMGIVDKAKALFGH